MAKRAALSMEIKGLKELIARAGVERVVRRPLRKAFRSAAKAVKMNAVAKAGPISRRVARRVRVEVDRAPVPTFARVLFTYPGAAAIDRGRRAGAKMPPLTAIRGGYGAAKAIAERGVRARPFVAPAVAASQGAINATMATAASEIEAAWQR